MKSIKKPITSILNKQVLVLNQNYHPLLICTAKRAISLAFLGKVKVVENYKQRVSSPSLTINLPSVVKLDKFVNVRNNKIVLSRKNILKRDQHQCQYCLKTGVPMTIDHIIPKEKKGPDSWENLVACCHKCNIKKGNRNLEQSEMKLIRKPKQPTRIHYIRQFVKRDQSSWKPYLYMGNKELRAIA